MSNETIEFLKWAIGIPAALVALVTIPYVIAKNRLECRKLRLEIDQLTDSHDKLASAMSKSFGFKYRTVEMEYHLQNDGKLITRRSYELVVSSGSVGSLDYSTWVFSDKGMRGYSRVVTGRSQRCAITDRSIHVSDKGVRFAVDFSPALTDEAFYEIKEECYGGVAITREQVLKQIKQGTWPTQEPYDMHTFLIRYAVELAVLTASFPASYAIGNVERWDVMIGYTANKALKEYADLKATNRLRYSETVKNGRRIISVVIREPKPGLTYFLKWQPPWYRECPDSMLANA